MFIVGLLCYLWTLMHLGVFGLGKRVNRCCMGKVYVWVSDQLLYGKSVVVAFLNMYVAFFMVAGWFECKAIPGSLLLGLSSLSF